MHPRLPIEPWLRFCDARNISLFHQLFHVVQIHKLDGKRRFMTTRNPQPSKETLPVMFFSTVLVDSWLFPERANQKNVQKTSSFLGEDLVISGWRSCHFWVKILSLLGEDLVTSGWRSCHFWVKIFRFLSPPSLPPRNTGKSSVSDSSLTKGQIYNLFLCA